MANEDGDEAKVAQFVAITGKQQPDNSGGKANVTDLDLDPLRQAPPPP